MRKFREQVDKMTKDEVKAMMEEMKGAVSYSMELLRDSVIYYNDYVTYDDEMQGLQDKVHKIGRFWKWLEQDYEKFMCCKERLEELEED